MKITFHQQTTVQTEAQYTEKAGTAAHTYRAAELSASFETGSDRILPCAQQTERGKTLAQLRQEAANTNVAVQQDYRTLMANTMSEEDYAKLEEEGFHFRSLKPEEAVTIVDKIKAELARSGKQIVGYTDDLDMNTLAEALGSQTLAQAVADSFRQADIPLTQENLADAARGWDMASQLKPLTEGSLSYLIDNGLDGEIWNLYLAQNSGADRQGGTQPRFYAQEVEGYYTRSAQNAPDEELMRQIDRLLEQSGREVSDENRQKAVCMLEKGLPLTQENLARLEELEELTLPVTEEQFADSAAQAVSDGKSSVYGRLSGKETIYEKAARLTEYYQSDALWESTADSLAARRQLEEVRLRMTAEVNVKLLKSGFSIDTAPMEELVEALKTAERQLAEEYFPADEQAVSKYRLYCETNGIAKELPALPAQVLGEFTQGQSTATLETFHRSAAALRDTFEKASESYETLMTTPRSDLGDSIRKAFANVDDILRDLGQELTEENRRAVRILGYNRMELTVQNLEKVREADAQVKGVVEKLTPAATLKMIRDGINPLEQTFDELESYFASLPEEYETQAESYSRFLYGLERNNEITQQERESFIGVYRLVRQIEKSDGAAVGALVNAQAEVHFANLLSAVRSGKCRSIDTRVSDALGVVVGRIANGESISDQISAAFTAQVKEVLAGASYSEETQKAYDREQLEQLRAATAAADGEAVSLLDRGGQPVNADYLLAAEALSDGTENLLAAADRRRSAQKRQDSLSLWEKLGEKEEFQEEYRSLLEEAGEQTVQDTIGEADASVDVRKLQLVHKQLSIAAALSDKEEYFIPMYIGEELTRVHLTVDRSTGRKGTVQIDAASASGTHVKAQLGIQDGVLEGIFYSETAQEVMNLQRIADTFKEKAADTWQIGEIGVTGGRVSLQEASGAGTDETTVENAELYRVAKVFLEALSAAPQTTASEA